MRRASGLQPVRAVRGLELAGVLAALVPIATAVARAMRNGWLPIGDNGVIDVRVRDVFSRHPPLLGTWTSASLSLGTNVNNPGPLLFDLLAVPRRLVGGGGGLALAVGLLNAAAVVGIAAVAHRRGGALLTAAAMAATAALTWSMGSELLFDAWQPHSLLLPFLWFMVLAWSVSCGDRLLLPWLLGVASLLVQSHLSYIYLVPGLGLWALVGLVSSVRRDRAPEESAGDVVRRMRGVLVASAAVLAVSWVQPLVEQLTTDDGNLGRLLRGAARGGTKTIGFGTGAKVASTVLTRSPWWFRPGFGKALLPTISGGLAGSAGTPLPSSVAAVGGFAVLAVVLAGCARWARRRGDGAAVHALVTAAVAVGLGLFTAGSIPVSVFMLAPHQFRWLWPLAAFTTFAVVASVARGLAHHRPRVRAPLVAGLAVVTVVLGLLNVPASNQRTGPVADDWAIPAVRDLGRQLGPLRSQGTILLSTDDRFADPFGGALMAELRRRDIPFLVSDTVMARQLGEFRHYPRGDARVELIRRYGDATRSPPAGARLVASHVSLDARQQAELDGLRRQMTTGLTAADVPLDGDGRRAAAAGRLPVLARAAAGGRLDVGRLLGTRELVGAVLNRQLDLRAPWEARLTRYARLEQRWSRETVALFLVPIRDG